MRAGMLILFLLMFISIVTSATSIVAMAHMIRVGRKLEEFMRVKKE